MPNAVAQGCDRHLKINTDSSRYGVSEWKVRALVGKVSHRDERIDSKQRG